MKNRQLKTILFSYFVAGHLKDEAFVCIARSLAGSHAGGQTSTHYPIRR
jgi:hypothetical protein